MIKMPFRCIWEWFFVYFLIIPERKISPKKLSDDVIVCFFCIVDFFASLNSYPRHCNHELKEKQARISIVLYIRVVHIF